MQDSYFQIAKIAGEFDHAGQLSVVVIGGKKGFSVALTQQAAPMNYQFHLTPEQSQKLRAALEDAEAKAEILTAAI